MLKAINVRTVPGTPDHKMLKVETLRALCDICRKFNRLSCGCRLFLEQAGHSCYCVVGSPNGVRKPDSQTLWETLVWAAIVIANSVCATCLRKAFMQFRQNFHFVHEITERVSVCTL